MRIADCGSTWTKILDLGSNELEIVATKELVRRTDAFFEVATGHSGRSRCNRYKNELIALAEGGLALVEDGDFSLIDVGGRDIKFVRFFERRVDKLDWNLVCGSTTGATVELLGGYYGIDFESLEPSERWFNVTCGVFGMERVLESVSTGTPPQESIAMFVHGVVRNVFDFAGRPGRIHLSGGFCENRCFLETLKRYCDVVPLGRAVPLEGLKGEIA
ncbi:MAG TPA: ATPase [Candidatus Eisenbacteria bacterium]|uniref:ATPase n=1 Tax=Eiseniibacteriota bacterium TaxID=2212470 RepID=A0A7V2F2E8_UNCEI|nr:ATPase [Candidatus Eisenbacteria bacterium]